MTAIGTHKLSREQCATGLRAAAKILKLWQASNDQACRVLRVSRATYRSVFGQGSRSAIRLDADQMQRIGIILNMHSTLRTVFDNPENVYGFTAMANQNDFFYGRSPLEIMAQGDMISLYETSRRIQALSGAQYD